MHQNINFSKFQSNDLEPKQKRLNSVKSLSGACVLLLKCSVLLSALCSKHVQANTPTDERITRFSIIPTPSPEENFLQQPQNTSVPETSTVFMKCKVFRMKTFILIVW